MTLSLLSHALLMADSIVGLVCFRPVEGDFEGNFVCEVEANESTKHIPKTNPKSSKIPD